MFNIFNIEKRKQYTKDKIKKISDLLISIFKSEKKSAWFAALFLHYLPHTIMFWSFIFQPFNLFPVFFLIVTYFLHLFFNGCIHMRLERNLFNDKNWIGPYYFLNYLNFEINNESTRKNFLYMFQAIILIIYIIKYIFQPNNNNNNNFPGFLKNKLLYLVIIGYIIQVGIFISI